MKKYIKLFCVILFAVTIFIFSLPSFGQIDRNFYANGLKALEANTTEECTSSLKFCNEVLKIMPDHPFINYLAARLNALLGNSDIALDQLKKAAKLGYTSSVSVYKVHQMNDPAFNTLRQKKEFEEIFEIMKISDQPVHKSRIAFTVKDMKNGTEGITYDPVEEMFYLGSDNKIVRVDHSGNSTVFTVEAKEDQLGSVNGIHVDPVRRTLWACSNQENKVEILKYNLSSGKLIKKYAAPSDGNRHFFNDLVIHPNGDVYISDTLDSSVFKISYTFDKLELFLKNKLFITGLNGITLSEDGRVIYVANDNLGIYKININTKSFTLLTHEQDFHTYGIDGLYFADNYLYAIQPILLTQVSRFSLNEDAVHLEDCEIFEKNTDDLRGPTTGVIVNDYFYFIADARSSQKGVVVMKTSIK